MLSLSRATNKCNALRVDLAGYDRCATATFAVTGQAPVLALCRHLLARGFDPDQPLEIYRGATLALRVGASAKVPD